MDAAKARLKGERISEEQIEERRKIMQDLENRQGETNRILGGLRKEREQTEKAWKEKEILEEKMGQIRHKLDLFLELEGLFRGKKFVEYVARYYMEYVSREADEKLKEMTGNSLGLETDQNGLFIIRDYKNGGATRPGFHSFRRGDFHGFSGPGPGSFLPDPDEGSGSYGAVFPG